MSSPGTRSELEHDPILECTHAHNNRSGGTGPSEDLMAEVHTIDWELRLGFLINFNEAQLKSGITRITNGAEGKAFFSS